MIQAVVQIISRMTETLQIRQFPWKTWRQKHVFQGFLFPWISFRMKIDKRL